jgi:predicted permease
VVGASLLAVAAAVVAAVAVLAATGRLRRNSVAGIRIPSLYGSEAAWRTGHRAAVLPTVVAAVICVALAVVEFADPDLDLPGAILQTVVLLLGVVVGTALASRAAREHSGGHVS